MKNVLNFSALLMLLAFAGCQKDVQPSINEQTTENSNARAAANTPLIVTVVDAAPENVYKISSDNATPYVNGQQQVEAVLLSSDGNFYMNTNSNTVKPTLRWLKFADATLSGKTMNGLPNYSLRTTIADGAPWIQNMAEGSSQLVGFRIWGVKLKGVTDWRLVYKNGYESDYWNTASLTDYAKVTRGSGVDKDRWTIEPANHPGVTYANAAIYPGNANSSADRLGHHVVPFKLILNKK